MTALLPFHIAPVREPADIDAVAGLFRAYAGSLGFDLGYQGFAAELRSLPGKYAPPSGELLLARLADGTACGCVALRPIDPPGTCEMKRLYVSPEGRGLGIGQALVAGILATARAAGHRQIRLDTASSMASAVALYRRLGFHPIAPYCHNPFPDPIFLALDLTPPGG